MATVWKRSVKGWVNRAEDNLTASRDSTVQRDVTRREPILSFADRSRQSLFRVALAGVALAGLMTAGMQVAPASANDPTATEAEVLAAAVAPEMAGASANFCLTRGEATSTSSESTVAVSTDAGVAQVGLFAAGASTALVEIVAEDVGVWNGVTRAAGGAAVVLSPDDQSLVVEHITEQLRLQVLVEGASNRAESRFAFLDSGLEPQPDGTVEVWHEFSDAPGALFNFGHIAPAWAFAADGTLIPSGHSVEGDTLVQWIDLSSAGGQTVIADPTFVLRQGQLNFKLNRSETVDWYHNRGNYMWIVAVCSAGLGAAASVGGPWGTAFGAISGGIWCGVNFANIANNLGYAYRNGTCFRFYTGAGIHAGTMRC